MSLLIYSAIFWVIAIISSILQDRFPDVKVTSYQTVVKAIPTLLALGYVFYALPSGSLFYILLGIALFFCMLGDVAMEKDIIPGIGMFLFAHLFFTVNFVWQAVSLTLNFTNMLFAIACLGGFVVYVFMFIRYLQASGPEVPDFVLKAGSFYFILVSATISTSLLLWLTTGALWGFLPLIGALFFIISDSIIAINEFHHKLSRPELLIMPTYYLAIFLLSLGVVAFVF
ncbi:MAG: lysoplasmalogenase [Candidatus Thorarchaeota archaeon]|nr:MAG: lysoplasmalogenase [Candidatus Thorarchaeota archaeon]